MPGLTVTLIQTELAWEDRKAKPAHFNTLIERLGQPAGIVLLPEMFTTVFTMRITAASHRPFQACAGMTRAQAADVSLRPNQGGPHDG